MGFLDRLQSSKNSDHIENWLNLDSKEAVDTAIEKSFEKPVAFFKHSTRCGISVQVKTGLEDNWDIEEDKLDMYYLDLLNHRDISAHIAEKTGVIHQSPQLILVKDGKVSYHQSHFSIKYDELQALV